MRKAKSLGLLVALVAILCSVQTSRAGETTYYKNLSFTVRNPETANGRVYLTPYNASDTTYCTISKDPKVAKVEGNFSNTEKDFRVNMFALPADGYVLDCLSTPNAYSNGNYRSEYVGNTSGYPLSSTYLILDQDTVTNCTKVRPDKGSYMSPAYSQELYAVFVPAKKMSVRNTVAGKVSSVVKAGRYGEAANDLVVTGPINEADLKYLNKLSQEKGLIRLDLSGASFTTVPDSTFYRSGLYELKLPSSIKVVGNYAFAFSMGLKPVKLPSNISRGVDTIKGCRLMEMLGVKDTNPSSNVDDLDWLLSPYLLF